MISLGHGFHDTCTCVTVAKGAEVHQGGDGVREEALSRKHIELTRVGKSVLAQTLKHFGHVRAGGKA